MTGTLLNALQRYVVLTQAPRPNHSYSLFGGGECHHGANLNYGLPAPQQTGITVWSWSKLELRFGHRPLQLELQFGHEADLEFISPPPPAPLKLEI